LTTPRALRDYVDLIGIPTGVRTTDRYQHIRRIIEFLRSLPKEQIVEKIRSTEDLGEGASTLQRWADIILRQDGR
jgi:hypothetical protein